MARYPQIDQLVDRARKTIVARGYSRRTLTAYLSWIEQFLRFHGSPHPDTLGSGHAKQFLEHLRTDRHLAAKTTNQAASAIAFLYRELLDNDAMERVPRARGRRRVPVVLSSTEASRILRELHGTYWLVGALLYGTGMRLNECLCLRVKDLDFDLCQIAVQNGKGGSHRYVPLPDKLRNALTRQVSRIRDLMRDDRARGAGWAQLPGALHRKDPSAGYSLAWQFLFPASRVTTDPATRKTGRYHLDASAVQKRMKEAVTRSRVLKNATCHSLRHSFATQMLRDGCDIRTVQRLMGHSDVRTTMIYLHATDQIGVGVRSPFDRLRDVPDDSS